MSGHASHAERLEIMREAYRKVFGAEMPEPDVDGAITLLIFSLKRGDGGAGVSVRVMPPAAPSPPPDAPDLWLGSDL